jgi:hypothetical protein
LEQLPARRVAAHTPIYTNLLSPRWTRAGFARYVFEGLAAPFGRAGHRPGADQPDVFAPGAFTRSIARGGVEFRLDHLPDGFAGQLEIWEDAFRGGLAFRFEPHDDTGGRALASILRAEKQRGVGRVRGCSIGWGEASTWRQAVHGETVWPDKYGNNTRLTGAERVWTYIALDEISLCVNLNPVWPDTSITLAEFP